MESTANLRTSLKAILEEKKGERRVLVLYGRENGPHQIIEQQEILHPKDIAEGMAERDLDVIVLVGYTLPEPDRWFLTHSEFKLVPSEDFQGWLLGKDGEIKHTFKQVMQPDELFKLIDSMPMRKDEMKKKS
ncbi:DUF4174 domain-containing protein [Tellurirhabdus rosea]|uniref:DUF4174 domain-containing protein n=1 Tax=Tellurirhabdus rosea TaxID=2674997 RepID=UPI0022522E12|nr:DUF4174 domain-containing protein [Tellurirhabdus rosea]